MAVEGKANGTAIAKFHAIRKKKMLEGAMARLESSARGNLHEN
jgi:hypothetical protein